MSKKYEITYWDHKNRGEVFVDYTDSFIKALYLVLKLSKKWYRVSLHFRLREDRVNY